ncbi:hypothetical protein WDW89_01385 [Deltaproteobacteria bacterium TL4]
MKKRLYLLSIMFLGGIALTLLWGCGEDPATPTKKVQIDIRALKLQLGIMPATGRKTPLAPNAQESEAVNKFESFVIGALPFIVHKRPYSVNESLDTVEEQKNGKDVTISDQLSSDLGGATEFITVMQLSELVGKQYAEVLVPNISGGFQIISLIPRFKVLTIGDLSKEKDSAVAGAEKEKNSALYYGFTNQAFKSADELEKWTKAGNILTMQRACAQAKKRMPKGCAVYSPAKKCLESDNLGALSTDSEATARPCPKASMVQVIESRVTAAVEILRVEVNDQLFTAASGFPMIVRGQNVGQETGAVVIKEGEIRNKAAETVLDELLDQIKSTGTSLKKLTVVTTHALNPVENADCKKLSLDKCEPQKYVFELATGVKYLIPSEYAAQKK